MPNNRPPLLKDEASWFASTVTAEFSSRPTSLSHVMVLETTYRRLFSCIPPDVLAVKTLQCDLLRRRRRSRRTTDAFFEDTEDLRAFRPSITPRQHTQQGWVLAQMIPNTLPPLHRRVHVHPDSRRLCQCRWPPHIRAEYLRSVQLRWPPQAWAVSPCTRLRLYARCRRAKPSIPIYVPVEAGRVWRSLVSRILSHPSSPVCPSRRCEHICRPPHPILYLYALGAIPS
ncbi:hypothetical protein B0H14DRAFT_3876526 [Mycena olivaceomarginata]|nr:hypothetical protein B0H14DRAFT_3876526 [Mycena olivaceomarginata]